MQQERQPENSCAMLLGQHTSSLEKMRAQLHVHVGGCLKMQPLWLTGQRWTSRFFQAALLNWSVGYVIREQWP